MFKLKFILAIVFALAIATVGVCNSQKTVQLQEQQDGPPCIPHILCPAK